MSIKKELDKIRQDIENYKGEKANLRKLNKVTDEVEKKGIDLRKKKTQKIKVKNKIICQSYLLTVAKQTFNIYEKRIVLMLMKEIQKFLSGKKLNKDFSIDDIEEFKNGYAFEILLSNFSVEEKENNYACIKNAIISLAKKQIIAEGNDKWVLNPILSESSLFPERVVRFELKRNILERLFNFSKGFSQYQLGIAMSLRSVHSIRMYELVSNNKEITRKIEDLKKILGIEKKYKNDITRLKKRILDKSRKELNEKADWSYNYKLHGKSGTKKVNLVTIVPYHLKKNDPLLKEKEQEKMKPIFLTLGNVFPRYLSQKFGFTEKGMQYNLSVLQMFLVNQKSENRAMNVLDILYEKIKRNDLPVKNIQGACINYIKVCNSGLGDLFSKD